MFYKYSAGASLSKYYGWCYYFRNGSGICFIDCTTDDYLEGYTPYVISSGEAEKFLKDYNKFIKKYNQTSNVNLTTYLQSFDANKEFLSNYISARGKELEENQNKNIYFDSSLGFKCDGDRRSKSNIQDLISVFDDISENGVIEFRDYDNNNHQLTKEQLETLLMECVTNIQSLYQQKWEIKSLIESAESIDDLHNINIEFTMKNFSES